MHQTYLLQALELAWQRRGFCAPNPAVGAILVKNGRVVGAGCHHAPGHAHAETVALEQAGDHARDATLYVTLEPCCCWGRTPPCTSQIIAAGIKEVIFCMIDPNPDVCGQGIALLREAGINCQQIPLSEVDLFYRSYGYFMQQKKPWVSAKIALSLDGKIAGQLGTPVKITGDILNAYTHHQRKQSDIILTTGKTIQADDPQLNARLSGETIAKPIAVIDCHLNINSKAQVFTTAQTLIVFHGSTVDEKKLADLQARKVQCVAIPELSDGLDLSVIISELGRMGYHDVWVEAGGNLFTNLFQRELVNTALIYLSAQVLGTDAHSAFNTALDFRQPSHTLTWETHGQDALLRIEKQV